MLDPRPALVDERIPFSRPTLVGTELAYIADVLASGRLAGGGHTSEQCQQLLERELGSPVQLTTSCTHALELAALVLGLGPGDEVVIPSFTFPSTANAFVLRGATPVFVDIRPDTLNLDEAQLDALITDRTRAVVPVHYAGVACEMDSINAIAAARGVDVVEDNAHGLFGRYRGKPLGTLGRLAALSFHDTKNITSGEGGALVVNDARLRERAEMIADKGTDRAAFLRGDVRSYSWQELGSSYAPSEVLAALLLAQLEARAVIQEQRRRIWDGYHLGLRDWAGDLGVQLPAVPVGCQPAYHLFHVVLPDPAWRPALMDHLAALGIGTAWHYVPLHASAAGRAYSGSTASCPVAEAASTRLLRLPFFAGLTDTELERVVAAVSEWRPTP